ncbi:MAG TPA: alpha/beta hydrolase [Gemmatimonadales bacterium]|nr:alpha/beta hydrolase [Gemmatimonadales bacterium]
MILALLSRGLMAQGPASILLWPHGAPGSEGKAGDEAVRLTELGEHIVSRVHRPSLTPYLPEGSATGAAVIVVPGGGHRELWMDHEGYRVGQWLADHGIAAFVLKYRLAREEGSTYTVDRDELADVQRAIRLVRSQASTWHVAPDRIGVIGFSAGGELAALAGTRYDTGAAGSDDSVARESSRPAFVGLIYPSIPAGLHFPEDTPPAFLLCGEKDSAIAEGLPVLYGSWRQAGASAEMHILTGAGHGFGIRDNNAPGIALWTTLWYDWLDARGMLGIAGQDTPLSRFMREGIPAAGTVREYTVSERGRAAHEVLNLTATPILGPPVSLTPDAPFGSNGAHLSIWKPSFVLGTAGSGEVGVNFWGIHNEGHVNIGFTPTSATTYLLDCRMLSAGPITYKVYDGPGEALRAQGQVRLADGHFFLMVPPAQPLAAVSVELWPTPVTEPMGLLGCDLSVVTAGGR